MNKVTLDSKQQYLTHITKTCSKCGKEFHPITRQRTICNDCRTGKCVDCGAEFLCKKWESKRCDKTRRCVKCRAEKRRKDKREYRRLHKERYNSNQIENEAKEKEQELINLNEARATAGLHPLPCLPAVGYMDPIRKKDPSEKNTYHKRHALAKYDIVYSYAPKNS